MSWAPDYLTLEQYKAYPRIDDSDDDAELASAITAASRAIDEHCNRQFGRVDVAEQRTYPAWYNYDKCRWVVDIDDLQSTAGLVVEVDGATVTDYVLGPRNAVVKGFAWTRLVFGASVSLSDTDVDMTALWGWTTFPGAVVQACKLQTSRFAARRDSPYGVAGSPQLGSELRLLARVDPDVGVSLRRYRRPRKVG